MKKKKWVVLVVFFVIVLTGCRGNTLPVAEPPPTEDSCPAEEIEEFIAKVEDLESDFQALVDLAAKAEPEDLKLLVKDIQDLAAEGKNIKTPPCALKAKASVENYLPSQAQCFFSEYAKVLGINRPNRPEEKGDPWCTLASQQKAYYQEKMIELNELLVEKRP